MATALEIATRVRNLISERSPAAVNVTIPHIQALITNGAEVWGRGILENPNKREYLRKAFTATIGVDGTTDLTNHVNGTTGKIDLHELDNSTIYATIGGVRTPFTWVASQAQLNYQQLPGAYPAVFREGTTLRTRDAAGSQTGLNGTTISFTVINYPTTAATIPDALLGDFVTFLADMAVKERVVDSGAPGSK